MRLYPVSDDERQVWVAALAHETMNAYVADTGKFHNDNALRNDFYMVRHFRYEPIGPSEARKLIDQGVGTLNEIDHPDALAKWYADPSPLTAADVVSMAAGYTEQPGS